MTGGAADGTDRPDAAHLLRLVRAWAPQQRWFPAKGEDVVLEPLTTIELAHPRATVLVQLLHVPAGGVLQVPLVLRPGGAASGEEAGAAEGGTVPAAAVLGTLPDGRVVVDGCHDPSFVEAWFAAATVPDGTGGSPVLDVDAMQVLSGEQSNTSVLLPRMRPPGILKVFRGVAAGPNPDVEVPLALSEAGWRGVPRPLAWLDGRWPDTAGHEGGGHLGVLSELVTDAEDGFELACRWAGQARDLAPLAGELGRTTAQMHDALRKALPVVDDATPSARADRVLTTLRERAGAAVAAAPVLAARADRIDTVLTAVASSGDLPPLQRVHGDYHLGQVLHSDERGWVVLDFEGEPQAPAAERTRPDLALRDLAGMLRSMDYAAAVGGAPDETWTLAAREALVAGYLEESGAPPVAAGADGATTALLRALELDKALYEVVYETRNRPTWVSIPLDGVDRLLAGTAG